MSDEMEDVVGVYKKLTLDGKTLNHRELTIHDYVELKVYIKELIESDYKENKALAETIEDENLKSEMIGEITRDYIKRRRNPEHCDISDSTEVHVYMLWLALNKKVDLKDCTKWATPENSAIIQDRIKKKS